MLRHIAPLAMAFALASSTAAPRDPHPGIYILPGDAGSLDIQQSTQGLTFEIDTVGDNCHVCHVSGVIQHAIGHSTDDDGRQCDIAFEYHGSTVTVRAITEESCRNYCGVRAGFQGKYSTPPASCTSLGMKAQHDKALGFDRLHHYAEAVATLRTLMSQCANFIDWITIDKLRNDLALAQYHNGEYAQCLKTLEETRLGSAEDEAAFNASKVSTLPSCDLDNYIDTAQLTWSNRALCTKALAKQAR